MTTSGVWFLKSWYVNTTNSQVDKNKIYKENLDTIYVVMWDDHQHTLLGGKSKAQDSEYNVLPFVYKKGEHVVST